MFEYDPQTNRLSLRPGKLPPWIRKETGHGAAVAKDKTKCWSYCLDCKQRYCPDTKQRPRAFLTFRDKAAQLNLRPNVRQEAPPSEGVGQSSAEQGATQATQPEPETEPQLPEDAAPFDDNCEVEEGPLLEEDSDEEVVLPVVREEEVPDLPPAAVRPTLDEYEARWAQKLAAHSKTIAEDFSLCALVPTPSLGISRRI